MLPARYAGCPVSALTIAQAAIKRLGNATLGGSWTTDAPFRETEAAIVYAPLRGSSCSREEAAALYALAAVMSYPILCVAHVTNTMAQAETDFEKGEQFGKLAFIALVSTLVGLWKAHRRSALDETTDPRIAS